jgi:phosphoglycerol transferase MdoB-like AlkP superfamily enzyme
MHGFPFWFAVLLHPLTWALLVALVLASVIFGWRRALFTLLLIPAGLLCIWDPRSRSLWKKWFRNGGL